MKKILSSILILFLFLGINGTSYAQENENLSYDEAVKISISNNSDLRKLRNQESRAQSQSRDLSYDINLIGGHKLNDLEAAQYIQNAAIIDLTKDQISEIEKATIEGIKVNIMSIYNNIDKIGNETVLLNEKISYQIKELELLNLQFDLGVKSRFEKESLEKQISTLKSELQVKHIALEKEYIELNKILGFPSMEIRNIENLVYEYKPLDLTEAQLRVQERRSIESNLQVWAKKKDIDLKKLDLDLYSITAIPIAMSGGTLEPYQIKKIDKSILENELRTIQENVKKSVKEKYNSLNQLEASIENLEKQLIQIKHQKKLMEVQLTQGMIIPLKISSIEMQERELENIIFEMKKQHEYIKSIFMNPVVAGN